MLIAFLQILLSLNLVAIFQMSYNFSLSQKEILFESYYSQEEKESYFQIEEINNILFSILDDLQNDPEFRIYRYTGVNPTYENNCINLRQNQLYNFVYTIDLKFNQEQSIDHTSKKIWLDSYDIIGKSQLDYHIINLIKGIHDQITISILELYLHRNWSWLNLNFVYWIIGYQPDRIKDLYYLEYVFYKALRFLNIKNIGLKYQTQQKVEELISLSNLTTPYKFDEFNNLTIKDIEEFRQQVERIDSYINQCICHKCQMLEKLQIHGLQIAMNLLFDEFERTSLEKNDAVAFIQTLYKTSKLIKQLDEMFEQRVQITYEYVKLACQSFILLSFLSQAIQMLKK